MRALSACSARVVHRFQQVRCLHSSLTAPRVPAPIPFVPDSLTFLTLIGRGLSQHAGKIPTWDALFSLSSRQLRELGVEPARDRRYLLRWRERYRNGELGVGGDCTEVRDGVAQVRVVEVPATRLTPDSPLAQATATRSAGMRKIIVNVAPGDAAPAVPLSDARPVDFMTIKGSHTICGPHVQIIKGHSGRAAMVQVKEGLWEFKRGRKIDGGERRQAEVRHKRRVTERRALEEAAGS